MHNTQIILNKIFTKALLLLGDNYKQLEAKDEFNKCNCLYINNVNKTFWFTNTN